MYLIIFCLIFDLYLLHLFVFSCFFCTVEKNVLFCFCYGENISVKKDQVLPRINNLDANKFSRFATITFCVCVLLTPHITIVYYWH